MFKKYCDYLFAGGVGPLSGLLPFKILGTDTNSKAVYYYAPFDADIEDNVGLINNTNSFGQFLRLNFTVPQTGRYEIVWDYIWSLNIGSRDFIAQVELNDTTLLSGRPHVQEPKDVAGSGETLPLVGGGTLNSGTDQRHHTMGRRRVNLGPGSNFVDIDFRSTNNGDRAAIYHGSISVKRVG